MKETFVLGGIVIMLMFLLSCDTGTKNNKSANMKMMEHMHHNMTKNVDLGADIPIFQPAKQSFTNHIEILSSENIYVRYNTSMKNKDAVLAFYYEELPKLNWDVIPYKSSSEKIAIKKGNRYGSVRFFELKEADSTLFAYSINLVRPKQNVSNKSHSTHNLH